MAQADEFGSAVFNIQVTSDAELRASMQNAESIIEQATLKMESDFDRVVAAQQRLSTSVSIIGSSVAVLGAAAAATGNRFLGVASSVGALTATVGLMAVQLGATTASMWGLVAASTAFLITPLGLALTAIVGLVGGAALAVESFIKVERDADAALLETEKKADAAWQARKKRDADDLKRTNAKAESEAKLAKLQKETARGVILGRIDNLKQQLQIERGIAESEDFIENSYERSLAIELKRVIAAKEIAKAKEAEAKAFKESIGPQTLGGAGSKLFEEFKIFTLKEKSLALEQKAFEMFAKRRGLSAKEIEGFKAFLGQASAATTPTVGTSGTGSIALSSFVQSGAGRGSVSSGDPEAAEQKRLAKERTKAATKSQKSLESIERSMSGGAR